jgi:hypothetical protein
MERRRQYFYLFFTATLLFLFINLWADSKNGQVQDNPVLAPDVTTDTPAIDGIGNDTCWQNLPWQSIDQVWIPYGGSVTSDDYTGHYKIVWSSTSNLLYFLIEVTDDVFVDGYVAGQTADIYNFDITEVFIDEDTSGGPHIYDNFQSNAENAFAYHIYAAFPAIGQVTTEHQVDDMAGASGQRVDYSAHLPDFALRKSGNTAVWEFSLIVYNDTYEQNNPAAARVQLQADKMIGLSVAYCDNDNPNENPKVRDNMFGSVWEPSPGNLHWQNADYFGRVKLVENITNYVSNTPTVSAGTLKLYPNPTSSSLQLQIKNPYQGKVSIRVFNILGQEVFRTADVKSDQLYTRTLGLNHLPAGLYFLQTQMGQSIFRGKLIITPRK